LLERSVTVNRNTLIRRIFFQPAKLQAMVASQATAAI
jgi:hypothetical protein